MRLISNKVVHKTASLPPDIAPPLNDVEQKIFDYIKRACAAIPELSRGKYGSPTARVAGGWIRDKLLPFVRQDVPVKPPKDLDIAIDLMDGGEFGRFLQIYDKVSGENAFSFGADRGETANRVGVCFCRIYGEEVEFLQLRKESYGVEGDRQSVETEVGSLEEDTYRRDLTINSMYYNINTGRVEDLTGQGYDDLAALTLRTPSRPDMDVNAEVHRIFTEDPVRVLRVLRFNSRWPNARIAEETLNGMRDPKVQQLLTQKIWNHSLGPDAPGVPPEKTAEEFKKMMAGEQPEASLRIMLETGVLQKLLNLPPAFHPLHMDQMNHHHELTLIEHTLQVLKNVNNLSQEFGFDTNQRVKMNIAALMHDIGKLDPRSHKMKEDGVTRQYMGDPDNPDAMAHEQSSAEYWDSLSRALKMSDEDRTEIGDIVAGHMNPHAHEMNATDRQLRKYIRKNPSWVFQYVHAMADAMSKSKEPSPTATDVYRANFDRLHTLNQPVAPDLLNGHEIINLVGLPPNPPSGMQGYIGIVKERIRDAQDDNPNLTKDDAVAIVQNMISSGELDAYRQV